MKSGYITPEISECTLYTAKLLRNLSISHQKFPATLQGTGNKQAIKNRHYVCETQDHAMDHMTKVRRSSFRSLFLHVFLCLIPRTMSCSIVHSERGTIHMFFLPFNMRSYSSFFVLTGIICSASSSATLHYHSISFNLVRVGFWIVSWNFWCIYPDFKKLPRPRLLSPRNHQQRHKRHHWEIIRLEVNWKFLVCIPRFQKVA
jgi:hypothetical protein